MGDYELRKDIDRFKHFLDALELELQNKGITSLDLFEMFSRYYDKSEIDMQYVSNNRLGLDQQASDKFNFAVITKIEDDIEYQEFWVMSNAYYDYNDGHFHKIDMHNTSFGIQIQAKGAFPGEAELGYYDNSGINIWRNPSLENLDWATTEQKRCLVETGIIGEYDSRGNIKTFQVSCGWNNAFMFDSYGGMTIGGTGFEIDGNGIFPYTRVANCLYTNPTDNKEYGYIALLHNAYNSTRFGWDCDSNRTYSWLMGIHAPVDETLGGNNLDLSQADFRVMYNDTPWNSNDTHELDITKWHTILKVDTDSIDAMVNGALTTLNATDLSNYVTSAQLSNAISNVTSETGSTYLTKSNANTTYVKKTDVRNDLTHTDTDKPLSANMGKELDNNKAPNNHKSSGTNYGVADASNYGHTKASSSPPGSDIEFGSAGTANGVYANADHTHPRSGLYADAGHGHTTDDIRLAGTSYAITSMLNAMYTYYQQQSSSSPTWSGDSQNHVYVRDIIWDSTYQEYKIVDDITDNISPGTLLVLNVASTTGHLYGGHDLYSFRNNGYSLPIMTNADMTLQDYSTVILVYNRGVSTQSPVWIPILVDNSLKLNVDSNLVL